ncbi:unnamed protein product, partial [Rotaria magnacalcarata]
MPIVEIQTQIQMNSSQDSLNEQDSSTVTQTAEPKPSNNNSDIPVATN